MRGSGDIDLRRFRASLEEITIPEIKKDAMTIADQLIEEGRQEGRQEGGIKRGGGRFWRDFLTGDSGGCRIGGWSVWPQLPLMISNAGAKDFSMPRIWKQCSRHRSELMARLSRRRFRFLAGPGDLLRELPPTGVFEDGAALATGARLPPEE